MQSSVESDPGETAAGRDIDTNHTPVCCLHRLRRRNTSQVISLFWMSRREMIGETCAGFLILDFWRDCSCTGVALLGGVLDHNKALDSPQNQQVRVITRFRI